MNSLPLFRAAAAALLLAVTRLTARAEGELTVHEWGTFTFLQDEAGHTLAGINTDDEPVPPFVHRLPWVQHLSPTQMPRRLMKGLPPCRPDVTLRLETPVVYFHLPGGVKSLQVDVQVGFPGGWLTEFYPVGKSVAPGLEGTPQQQIDGQKRGSLSWQGLTVGETVNPFPVTLSPVWLAPRQVRSAPVQTASSPAQPAEAEQYLFYRGVGRVEAPLQITRDAKEPVLRIAARSGHAWYGEAAQGARIPDSWLVSVREDGQCAWRKVGALEPLVQPAEIAADFVTAEYAPGRLAGLKAAMHAALVADGLFDDEAQALLKTWEAAYFRSAGQRFFYLVPKAEIEAALPLEVKAAAASGVNISRTMVGRIELVTPAQRQTLRALASAPVPDFSAAQSAMRVVERGVVTQVFKGAAPMQALGPVVPPTYARYLTLGRFREALVLDQYQREPTEGLREFLLAIGLEAPKPATISQVP